MKRNKTDEPLARLTGKKERGGRERKRERERERERKRRLDHNIINRLSSNVKFKKKMF